LPSPHERLSRVGGPYLQDSQSRASAPSSWPAWPETAPRRRSERRRPALNLSLATHTPQLWLVAFVGLRSRPVGRLRPPYGVPILRGGGPLASIYLAQRPHLRASCRPRRVVGDVRQSMRGPIMDTALSFLISAGIIAFGVWVVAGTITAGWPWTLMGLLAVIVGLLSLYGSVRDARTQ
jgi:hypothetical protein